MRVLLHAGIDLSKPGGRETHVRELALGLAARGYEVDVWGRPARLPALRMVANPTLERYDVVHLHGGRVPRRLASHPRLIGTLHFCVAAKMLTYVRIGRLRTLANLSNWRAVAGERAMARKAARLIAVAERVRHDFERFHGLDRTRAVVIPNGYLPAEPEEERAMLRRRYAIEVNAPVLLTIGRDDFVKGYDLLGRAWGRVGAAARGAIWVTVGGRERKRATGRLVTGPVPHAEAASWIAAADFGALPSWYEGCSVALLEMLGGRLYTLAHDVGNAAEVIRPGVNGELVAPRVEDWMGTLARLLQAPPPRPQHGLDASFTWPAIVERTARVYQEIAGAHRSAFHAADQQLPARAATPV